jgi:DNA-binding Lrp family transcriptional regulator
MNRDSNNIDIINEKLIQFLEVDATQSSQRLGEKLGISATSVRRRIRDLKKRGILHLIGIVDVEKSGYMLPIIFLVDAEYSKIDSVGKALAKYPQVRLLSRYTGRYPLIATAVFGKNTEISDFLENVSKNVQGLTQIETLVCLRPIKGGFSII